MKDYSSMSDLEINIEVAVLQGFDREKCELGWTGKSDVGVEWSERTGYPIRSFNYCNNPADAWPIILKHKINIDHRDSIKAGAMAKLSGNNEVYAVNANPLRAAMEVYLMATDDGLLKD